MASLQCVAWSLGTIFNYIADCKSSPDKFYCVVKPYPNWLKSSSLEETSDKKLCEFAQRAFTRHEVMV